MPTIKLTRPKLDAGEKIYFGALIKGFFLTMKHAVKSLRGNPTARKGSRHPGWA
jgi:hypothetical protein